MTKRMKTREEFLQHWLETKKKFPDKLLLILRGDYYEAFGDDAKIIARELFIGHYFETLKDSPDRVQNAIIPKHTITRGIRILKERGYRVKKRER